MVDCSFYFHFLCAFFEKSVHREKLLYSVEGKNGKYEILHYNIHIDRADELAHELRGER